jgi:hypothetical protein
VLAYGGLAATVLDEKWIEANSRVRVVAEQFLSFGGILGSLLHVRSRRAHGSSISLREQSGSKSFRVQRQCTFVEFLALYCVDPEQH